MVICTAYLDASGEATLKFPVFTVSAVISRMRQWKRFESQWKKVLAREGVKEFHATDFAASSREYLGWKGKKEKRSRFFRDLLRVLANNLIVAPFGVSMCMGDWNEVNSEYMLQEVYYSPYAFCGFFIVSRVLEWLKKQGDDPKSSLYSKTAMKAKGD